jgi:hypothetical protein
MGTNKAGLYLKTVDADCFTTKQVLNLNDLGYDIIQSLWHSND